MTTNDWQAPGAGSAGAGDGSATTTGPEDGASRHATASPSPYAAPGSNAAAGDASPWSQPAGADRAAPYSQPYPQAPYGQAPYGQAPYGQAPSAQAPYGQAPSAQAPYGQAPAQTPQGAAPYGGAPYGGAPYGAAPYGAVPYGQPGQPTAGGYAQPYPAYGPPPGWTPPPQNDGMAIASLVTGIGGLVTFLVFLGPVALGLGIAALRRVARNGTVGKGMAWTGIATGALQTLILLAIIVFIILGVNGVFDDPYAYDSAY